MNRQQQAQKLTWKQFVDLCDKAGIKEQDEIDSIDISWGEPEYFECHQDEITGWQITLRAK